MKYLWCMKNPTLLILLITTLFCTCGRAQIDSLLTFPYKKEVQDIARVDGQQLSIVRFTEGEKKSTYCMMTMSDYDNISNSGVVAFNKENLTAFLEVLNKMSVIAGSEKANTHTEIVDGIRGNGLYLKVILRDFNGDGWKILFDRSPYVSITPIRFKISKLPDLGAAIKTCLELM